MASAKGGVGDRTDRGTAIAVTALLHVLIVAALLSMEWPLASITPLVQRAHNTLIQVHLLPGTPLESPEPPSLPPPARAQQPARSNTPAPVIAARAAAPVATTSPALTPAAATPAIVEPVAAATTPASIATSSATARAVPAEPVAAVEAPLQQGRPDYAYNPKPDYPMLMREQGIGGVVLFRVWTEADGRPGEIRIVKGSGFRLLDEAAERAVRQWRFVPSRRGNLQLASWVEFPVRFTVE
ncbi:energy transducer TonB [Uliginosibacterium sp. H3]|uniref:Energy transducer TonB n=1 Tax=Uliginosibacterium silvisoli TaxID=3114758 RepID=A0ABU6K0I3_9RHOO|nr:energy transducer TonB [Uliginosibacterium sp. H3]